jgi:tRNA uridine 5-carboxymethylaminomethyl modification enzyme
VEHALEALAARNFTPGRAVERLAGGLGLGPIGQPLTAEELLRRPATRYTQVATLAADPDAGSGEPLPALDDAAATETELRVKYAGYIRRQERSVRQAARLEAAALPDELDYAALAALRKEARQQLARVRPRTVGQAARVPGVTPADVAVLLVHLERLRAGRRGPGARVEALASRDGVAPAASGTTHG